MKELTNDDLDELVDGSVFGDWRGYAREVIEADRFLNAPADRDVMREALAELRAKVEALHNVSNYDIWFKNQVLALIDKMGGTV